MRKNGLPPGHDAVFSLKIGEISQVLNDSGGHYIYKVDSVATESLAEVKEEIHNKLQGQRMRDLMSKIQGPFSTEVNDAYFGTGLAAAPASGGANPTAK